MRGIREYSLPLSRTTSSNLDEHRPPRAPEHPGVPLQELPRGRLVRERLELVVEHAVPALPVRDEGRGGGAVRAHEDVERLPRQDQKKLLESLVRDLEPGASPPVPRYLFQLSLRSGADGA